MWRECITWKRKPSARGRKAARIEEEATQVQEKSPMFEIQFQGLVELLVKKTEMLTAKIDALTAVVEVWEKKATNEVNTLKHDFGIEKEKLKAEVAGMVHTQLVKVHITSSISPSPTCAVIALTPPESQPSNLRIVFGGSLSPSASTNTLYDTSKMEGKGKSKEQPQMIRETLEAKMCTEKEGSDWRCVAVTKESLSDNQIIKLCQEHTIHPSQMLTASTGRKVMRLTDNVVVKFGLGVTMQEAEAQRLAFYKTDFKIVRIPQVYHFFSRPDTEFCSTGYLIMEYINGMTLEQLDWKALNMLPRVVTALNAIHSVSSINPGPVSGGDAHGCLWSEYGSKTTFTNIADLEAYINERLSYSYCHSTISISQKELRLCHMDAAPRNFMLDSQGRLCLLDWATAGFHPRYFELWLIEFAQQVIGSDFGSDLLQHLNPSSMESLEVQRLSFVYRFNSSCTK